MSQTFPSNLVFLNFKKPVNTFIEEIIYKNADLLDEISSNSLVALLRFENFFRHTDWRIILASMFTLCLVSTRRLSVSIYVTSTFFISGALGVWDKTMQTLNMVIICLLFIVVIGFPTGVLMHKNYSVKRGLTLVMDLLQTMPSFVYLVPAIMLFGLGKVPAIIATVLYAFPRIARFTNLALSGVDKESVEAANAFGFHPLRTLLQIKIPLAMPAILGGFNQGIMMTLAMVVVASLVGARDLGEPVLFAIQRLDIGLGLQGGLAITLMAIAFDRLTHSIGQRWVPPK